MKHVLFISYHFPPLGGVGPRRVLRALPHLESFGWKPAVLTVSGNLPGELRDVSLLQKIPRGVPIYRAPIRDLSFLKHWLGEITPPDVHGGWYFSALKKLDHILEMQPVDAVVSVSAPYTAHLIGWRIQQKIHKPWIVDLRDEWSDNPVRRARFVWQSRLDSWLEARVFSAADRILMTTPSYCRHLAARLPLQERPKVALLTNGFDASDFARPLRSADSSRFHLVYSGSLYGPQNPTNFLGALRKAIQTQRIPANRVLVTFLGRASRSIEAEAFAAYAPEDCIQRIPFASHETAIRLMQQADALLLLIGSHRGEGNIPGKTFEYMAAQKPVLALVPPAGDTAAMLRTAGVGIVVDPEDLEGIENEIVALYQRWHAGALSTDFNAEYVQRFESRALTEQLAGYLDSAVGISKQPSTRVPLGEPVGV